MKLRHYQLDAIMGILDRFKAGDQRTLCVIPTGGGKTVVFATLAGQFAKQGRVMVLAHRDELIRQAARKIQSITGIRPEIEKADEYSSEGSMTGKPPIVVSSVQTQISGKGDARRMHRFDPKEFALIIVDECHHAPAATWQSVIDYYAAGGAKIVGMTATPDRADGEAMGQIFQSVAYQYTLPEIIADGYLVPILQHSVFIEGLDFSRVRTTAGDLNQGDLEAAMLFEEPLHGVVHATIEVACRFEQHSLAGILDDAQRQDKVRAMLGGTLPRKALIFATSVVHADRMAEIVNRWIPGEPATCIHGKLSDIERANRLRAFADGRVRFLFNCMIATEGFDEPSIELVVMARPTKSRALFSQMIGRGTRPAENIAHVLGTLVDAPERVECIASSEKPNVEVLDFVGNSGKHKLVSTVDILGDAYTDEERELARTISQEGAIDAADALETAKSNLDKKRREAEEKQRQREIEQQMLREQDAARRVALVGTTRYDISLLGGEGASPEILASYDSRHLEILRKGKVPTADVVKMTPLQARNLSAELMRRWKSGLCSYRQAKVLRKAGWTKDELHNMKFEEASSSIDALSKNGWRRPPQRAGAA